MEILKMWVLYSVKEQKLIPNDQQNIFAEVAG